MSRFKDRTEDFKDAVRKSAVSMGYNESKVASTMASFIIHKPKERSPFTRASLKTLESIKELEQFMLKNRKDYVDLHRTTQHEKDSIEQEITAFIKACREQIDILTNSITNEEANSKGWLGLPANNLYLDTLVHKRGVVLILNDKLKSVNAQFDQLRATRSQYNNNRVSSYKFRKPKRVIKEEAKPVNTTTLAANSESIEPDDFQAQPRRIQQQLLDDETQAIELELSNEFDGAMETETMVVKLSAMINLLATEVDRQGQQTQFMYDQALEATQNLNLGNKELSQAIQRNSSSRTFLLLFLFVLTFSVLFLDWYN